MTAILILLYCAFGVLLFRFKILKVRPFPIAGVVLGGIVMIATLIIT